MTSILTASAALRKLADDNLVEGQATWADDDDAIEMLTMVELDSADFLEVARLLAQGQNDEAESYLRSMDTASRERAYEAIESVKPAVADELLVITKTDLGRISALVEAAGLLDELKALDIQVRPLT